MLPQAADLEHRLADLEGQIDRLTLALSRWSETNEHQPPGERRLTELTDQCADILKQWTATSERHAHAVGELETRLTGWNDIETRLQRDASSRWQGLERTIEREWASLRHLHEEPARHLREQAETLTEISVNAAGSAQTGIERAEARLAALENDLHRRIDDLARAIHAALAELRPHGGPAMRSPASSWSLDEVTRLHHQLRDAGGTLEGAVSENSTPAAKTTQAARGWSSIVETPAAPMEPSDPGVNDGIGKRGPSDQSAWRWYVAFAGLAIAIGLVAALALSFYGRAKAAAERASEAQQRAELIASAANERIEAARQDATAQVTQARDVAAKAQVTSDVLAAADLVRFNLAGGDSPVRISAQLLWSRSRGMVFSASRMPPPPAGAIYQIWLLTAGDPISAGTVTPDPTGRVTLATDAPPNVPRPIIGVSVTAEPVPGSPAPSGAIVLGR